MHLDGLSMTPLITELNTRLAGGRIDKIYQPEKNLLILWIRQAGEDICLTLSANAENARINTTARPPENPAEPTSFCMLLRKHLIDGRIAEIRQPNRDRIAIITIDRRAANNTITSSQLIIEIMGKHSNIILVEGLTIVDAVKRVGRNISRYRQILPGNQYVFPPGQSRLDLFQITAAEFTNALTSQTGKLAKAIISIGQGIGPLTANELLWRTGLPADIQIDRLDKADLAALQTAIESLILPLKAGIIQPTVIAAVRAVMAFTPECLKSEQPQPFPTMNAAVDFFVTHGPAAVSAPAQKILANFLQGELDRLTRKKLNINTELDTANQADEYRKKADILMSAPDKFSLTSDEIILPDLYAEGQTVTIAINPELTLIENARNYYAKYNKMKRAQTALARQLAECEQEIAYLDSVLVALEQTNGKAEINDIRDELASLGYLKAKKAKTTPSQGEILAFTTGDNLTIAIGKNNRQNDYLTFKIAHATDLWLHVKDIPGSHVILFSGRQAPPDTALLAAAKLAAFFSKARQSATVPVDYTRRSYVKKPPGSKPGYVIYTHQKTLYVTPDDPGHNPCLKETSLRIPPRGR